MVRHAVGQALMRMECERSLGILVMEVVLWCVVAMVTMVTVGRITCHAPTPGEAGCLGGGDGGGHVVGGKASRVEVAGGRAIGSTKTPSGS